MSILNKDGCLVLFDIGHQLGSRHHFVAVTRDEFGHSSTLNAPVPTHKT